MPYMIEVFGCKCGHCIQQISHIANLTRNNPNVFIASISQDNEDEIKQLMERRPLLKNCNVGQDTYGVAQKLMAENNQSGIPHCFVFDSKQKMVFQGHPSDCDSIIEKLQKEQQKSKYEFIGKGHIL